MIVKVSDKLYMGWVDVSSNGELYNFSIKEDLFGCLDLSSLRLEKRLLSLFTEQSVKSNLIECLKHHISIHNFRTALEIFLTDLVQSKQQNLNAVDTSLSETRSKLLLTKHLREVGWEYISNIDKDWTFIQLKCVDSQQRSHCIDITIDEFYPHNPPTVKVSLPGEFDIGWNASCDLLHIKTNFERKVRQYEPFFQAMSNLQDSTWVLEPAVPSFSSCCRKIALDSTSSLLITIDPLNPTKACSIHVIGAEDKLQQFKANIAKNLPLWSEDSSIMTNIQTVLQVSLPPPPTAQPRANGAEFCDPYSSHQDRPLSGTHQESDTRGLVSESEANPLEVDCAICYTYALDMDPSSQSLLSTATHRYQSYQTNSSAPSTAVAVIPDQTCPTAQCGKQFHRMCLVDWLRSVPSTKTSFGTLFGGCPYCGGEVAVDMFR
jgi:E3 ubiquitin-protein ligase FANCL